CAYTALTKQVSSHAFERRGLTLGALLAATVASGTSLSILSGNPVSTVCDNIALYVMLFMGTFGLLAYRTSTRIFAPHAAWSLGYSSILPLLLIVNGF
ncbi:MAG: hypothetical protein RI911_503, partial [Candidatus Parcubacteria bacterium]